MTSARAWAHDLVLGARLAVSGRGGMTRLVLIAVGTGMGVAVLLMAASLVSVDEARKARENDRVLVSDEFGEPTDVGRAALLAQRTGTTFRDEYIDGTLFDPIGSDPALPPGIDRIPEPDEVYVSPALADLLASDDGELLRPRFPWTVAGTIGDSGLVDSAELLYYAGAELEPQTSSHEDRGIGDVLHVYGFGSGAHPSEAAPGQVLLALGGGVLLLVPVFVLVGASTRVAAAARERRLAALRLVGADANQTRRIAAGEALVGSVLGLLVGAAVFIVATIVFAEQVTLFGHGAFREDVRPSAFALVLIAMLVPALAVVSGVVALRHSVDQPLGATRRAPPPRRRLWWRLLPPVLGFAMLIPLAGAGIDEPSGAIQAVVVVGLVLIGISVPLLLPWLLQRAVAPLAGGSPSWQLAVRRLQLDSGTPARASAGIAALLTVAVAIQSLLTTTLPAGAGAPPDAGSSRDVDVYLGAAEPDEVARLNLGNAEGVQGAYVYQEALADGSDGPMSIAVRIGDCAALSSFAHVESCTDGDVFVPERAGVSPGEELAFSRWEPQAEQPTEVGTWVVSSDAQPVRMREDDAPDGLNSSSSLRPMVLVTTAAFESGMLPSSMLQTRAHVRVDPSDRDAIEHVRNALAPLGPVDVQYGYDIVEDEDFTSQLRGALLAGSLVVLVLAAASMLIVSIEQVRERRQQFAALAASGVPNRTLGASVLWQALLPFVVAATAAITVGIALTRLFARVFDEPVPVDWAGVLTLTGGCALAVLAVTVFTLPSLRAATRPEALRTE